MRILITNDDGIDSPGLAALAEALSVRHSVAVVAPDQDRSGFSHSITVRRPIAIRRIAGDRWAIDGTPVDCVRATVLGDFLPRPDAVVSGINLGANLGTDIIYSGTAGAARQASMMGIPAIAASCFNYSRPSDLAACVDFIASTLDFLIECLASRDSSFINLNVPPDTDGRVLVTRPGAMRYDSRFLQSSEPDGNLRFVSDAALLPSSSDDSEDRLAVESGAVSLSAMGLWSIDTVLEERLRAVQKITKGEEFIDGIRK